MSCKTILAAIAKNKPSPTPLTEIQNFGNLYPDLTAQFISVLTTIELSLVLGVHGSKSMVLFMLEE